MRSARRCSTTSTCAHAELMASRLRTISLRWPTNVLPNQTAKITTMMRMINPIFMFLSLSPGANRPDLNLLVLVPVAFRRLHIQAMSHSQNGVHIGVIQIPNIVYGMAARAQLQHILQRFHVKAKDLRRMLQHLRFGARRLFA